MNVNRLSQDLIRLYGARGQDVKEGGASQAADATNTAQTTDAAATENRADSFSMSMPVRDLARVLGIVKAAPDTRAERVRALRQQVSDGSYQISDEGIVSRLVSPGSK